MPTLIVRLLIAVLGGFILGSTVTPILWHQALVREAESSLSPFLVLSAGILLIGLGYAARNLRPR